MEPLLFSSIKLDPNASNVSITFSAMMGRIVTPSNSTTAMDSLLQHGINQDIGTMLDDAVNVGKEPLHCSFNIMRPGAGDGDATPTIHNAKRGKVFPSRFPPPPPLLTSETDDAGGALPRERPTGVVADGAPFEWRDDEARRGPARASAAPPQAPTADDFANLLFCEPSEEEGEARADLLAGRRDDAAPRRTTSSPPSVATTATSGTTSTTATATRHNKNKRKRRRVSFGASVPTVHLLLDAPPCRDMTPAERSALWLSRSDLEAIQSSARRCVKEMRDRVRAGRDDGAFAGRRSELRALVVAMEEETGESVRGMEHRVFRGRRTRRDLIRDVLECQGHVAGLAKFGHALGREEGAMLLVRTSQERSLKARRVAYVDARDDRREVYGDDGPAGGDGVKAQRTLKRRRRLSGVISL